MPTDLAEMVGQPARCHFGGVAQRHLRRTRAQRCQVVRGTECQSDPRRTCFSGVAAGDAHFVAADPVAVEISGDQPQRQHIPL
jgi:hypothetical protein